MVGVNKIQLNPATMLKIVQHYFDTVMFAEGQSPVVSDIDHVSGSFCISVDDRKPRDPE